MRLEYNDTTSDDLHAVGTGTWQYVNALSIVDTGKFIEAIVVGEWAGSGLGDYYCDNVYLSTGSASGQEDFDADTLPWWAGQDYYYHDIAVGTYYEGVASAYMGYSDADMPIVQDVNYLDSNVVTETSFYAYVDANCGGDVVVQYLIVYADRTYSSQTTTIDHSDGWILCNFTGFVTPNKLIIQIQIGIESGASTGYTFFDNVVLEASVDVDVHRFSWSLSPAPISYTNLTWTAYQGVNYVFTGNVFNSTGQSVENGTYSVIHSRGTTSGSILSGSFSFTIPARNALSSFDENFIISVSVDSGDFIITIVASWTYAGWSGSDSDTLSSTWSDFVLIFLFTFFPPLIIAGAGAKYGWGMQGFFVGLIMGVGGAVVSGLLPFWFVTLLGLGLVLFLISMIRKS